MLRVVQSSRRPKDTVPGFAPILVPLCCTCMWSSYQSVYTHLLDSCFGNVARSLSWNSQGQAMCETESWPFEVSIAENIPLQNGERPHTLCIIFAPFCRLLSVFLSWHDIFSYLVYWKYLVLSRHVRQRYLLWALLLNIKIRWRFSLLLEPGQCVLACSLTRLFFKVTEAVGWLFLAFLYKSLLIL